MPKLKGRLMLSVKPITLLLLTVPLVLLGCSQDVPISETATTLTESSSRTNFLIIVADDLGYSDLGAYGSEIDTPHIDKLAREGLMLTNFYVGGTCSPTRSMLMSGVDHHLVGLGAMSEHIAPNQIDQPGYEGYLNKSVVTIADRLSEADYQTYMAGKWHLGLTEETSPAARGFDRSYALLPGGAGHFDQTGLHKKVHPAAYREDGEAAVLPADFGYSTDFYTRTMIDYIESGLNTDQPFFGYLAYTAPHWPLQAPPEDIAKYKGRYDAGWQVIQQERFKRMKDLSLVPETAQLPAIETDWPAWEDLPPETRAYEARRMEVFAAMVDRLDKQIGVLIDYLKAENLYDNTVILFISDNGSEGAALQDIEPFTTYIPGFDGSLDALGTKDSYVFLEERWAQVGSTPYRLFKGMASDGGSHVPAFIKYAGAKNQGARYDGLLSILDIAPTLLDFAGIEEQQMPSMFPLQGKSILPALDLPAQNIRRENEGLGYELFNKRYYRSGKWKVVHQHEPWGPNDWQLYDVSKDPGESRDLSQEHPEQLDRLVSAWQVYAEENGVVLGNTPPER